MRNDWRGSETSRFAGLTLLGSIASSVLAISGCSTTGAVSTSGEPIVPLNPSVAAASPTDFPVPILSITAAPDVTVWDTRTSNPGGVPELGLTDWACGGLLFLDAPRPGAWVFAGVTELYTPVRDIVADRTGQPISSTTVYYYFTLQSEAD